MSEEQKALRHYTPEMVDVAMKIWMRSSVSLIDIRCKKIEWNKPLLNYLLPTSMFIYTHGAPASITLNEEPYQTGHYGLCHAGKGTLLSIDPIEADVQTFMVLYKAESAPFYKRNLRSLIEVFNPFTQVYGFSPTNPVFFMDKFRSMVESWNEKESVHQFYAKVLMYQLIHQIYIELGKGNIRSIEPDYVEWVKRHLDEHFTKQISIQTLSDMLPLSRSLLGRLFRKRENSSLQEYLNKKRLDAAKTYLEQTNATIQEIACGCGFIDEINMIRMFKKYVHMTPGEYRRKSTAKCTKNVIDNDYQIQYYKEGVDHQAQIQRDGELTMFGQTRSKEMILAAAMSLMLLLSACTSNTPTKGGASSQPTAQAQQTEAVQNTDSKGEETTAQTRIVKTVKGDIEVPLNPQRVIVLFNIGDVLAFGITPIAVDKFPGQVYYNEIEHISERPSWTDPEGMMALEPDLIILWGDGFYDTLKSVAPVIVAPDNLEERITLLGEVFGMEDRAVELLKEYEDTIKVAKERIQSLEIADKTFTVVQEDYANSAASVLWYKAQAYDVIYSDLGLKVHPKYLEDFPDKEYVSVSMEVAGQYMGDYLFHVKDIEGDNISKTPVWESFPPVRNENVVELDLDMFYWADIQSAKAQLEVIVDGIEKVSQK